MRASGPGHERWMLLLGPVSSFAHGASRTKQATGMIKKSYMLSGVESMTCLDQFTLNEGKHKRERDAVLPQMVMKRMMISYSL